MTRKSPPKNWEELEEILIKSENLEDESVVMCGYAGPEDVCIGVCPLSKIEFEEHEYCMEKARKEINKRILKKIKGVLK